MRKGQSLEAAKEQAQLVKEMLTSRGLRASAISPETHSFS